MSKSPDEPLPGSSGAGRPAPPESHPQPATDGLLRSIAARAHCLLWQAEIEEVAEGKLYWSIQIPDEEAARRFLPVEPVPGRSYAAAWLASRLEEDVRRMDAYGFREVLAGRSYRQQYRCRRQDGALRWLDEAVHVETLAPGRWRAVAVCTDITEQKAAEEALAASRARLRLLAQVTGAVVGAVPLKELARSLAEQVRQAFGVDASVIRLLEGEDLVLLTSTGVPPGLLEERLALGWGISREILQRRYPLFIPNVFHHPATAQWAGRNPRGYQFVSYAGAPLLVEDRVVGLLGIYAQQEIPPFHKDDLEQLQIVANHIAAAVVNDQLYREVDAQRRLLEAEIEERKRAEAERQAVVHQLRERVKELSALHQVGRILEEERTIDASLREVCDLLAAAYQYPEITAVRITVGAGVWCTHNWRSTPWTQSAPFMLRDGTQGEVRAAYLEPRPELDDGPFFREERELIESVAERLRTHLSRRQAEEALRESESHLRRVIEGTSDGFWDWDLLANRVFWSNRCFELIHQEPREAPLTPDEIGAFIHPDDRPRLAVGMRAHLEEGAPFVFECRFRLPSGEYLQAILRGRVERDPAGQPVRMTGSLTDVTELTQAQEELRQVLASTACLLWYGTVEEIDGELRWTVRMWDEAAAQEFFPLDLDPGERYDHAWFRSRLPEDQLQTLETATQALHSGASRFTLEFRCRQRDGKVRWIWEEIRVRVEGPGRWSLVGVCTDHTERKKAEDLNTAFRVLGERLNRATTPEEVGRTILEAADALLGWDSAWIELSQPVEKGRHTLLSYDIINGRRQEVPIPGPEPTMGPLARKAIRDGGQIILRDPAQYPRPVIPFGDVERPSLSFLAIPLRSGERALGALSIQSYRQNAYDPGSLRMLQTLADYCASALERTHAEEVRHALEEQLRQSQKMEAIGRLAGGVAHDFNNMLAVINGYSSLMLQALEMQSPHRPAIQEIQKAGERAAALTRQLLAYSRKQMVAPRVVDLNEIVRGAREMLQRMMGEDVRLLTDLAPDLGQVRADPSQIDQLLINLVVNARDAMPHGGTLNLSTRNVELHDADLRAHELAPGPYIRLTIADTGCGIAEEVMAHLFEPFFTTKAYGKGTGLGLATVYGIVKQSGGDIQVDSRAGEGATFSIYLPRLDAPPAAPKNAAETGPGERGSGTILLVEDEPQVRRMLAELLRQYGYHVLEAGGGQQGMEIASRHQEKIHLLLTDVVMPGMSGPEFAQWLNAKRPETRVLYMSGYTNNDILRHGVRQGTAALIQKPFSPAQLTAKIRQMLT